MSANSSDSYLRASGLLGFRVRHTMSPQQQIPRTLTTQKQAKPLAPFEPVKGYTTLTNKP